MPTPSSIARFYLGESTDHAGRSLAEILRWDHQRLEYTHDYIQWLFPLPEPSPVNPEAPVLDAATREEFRRSADFKARLLDSFRMMVDFYGLRIAAENPPRIERGHAFEERRENWLQPMNHNHLRITRILRSIHLLGLEDWARAFFEALQDVFEKESSRISQTTFEFWNRAEKGVR